MATRPDLRKHGHHGRDKSCRTRTYRTWDNMIQRCRSKKRHNWRSYVGKGITVCEYWLDFRNFLADMGERPEGMTIDRIDRDGNYERGNCRWATPSQQRRNQGR